MGVLDRFGEPLEDQARETDQERHDLYCDGSGLLGEDAFGRMVICAVCRPELADRLKQRRHRV